MAHQATMNHGPSPSINGVLGGLGDLGNNVVTLATLQAKLAAEDFRESSARALPAVVAAAVLVPLGFASITLGLMGVAYSLSAVWDMPLGRTMMLVAVGGIVLTAVAAVAAYYRFRASLSSFRRSREELERNIAWLGTVLLHSGR